ncbi:lipoprotein [Caballeronia choica]|uniref:Lipoprotein n=2 Tax=Caballeronia choica TaxID=326476 RepID=A0A158KYG9_9BURK|nr:lipoprotein [Caballeronia choica]
MPRTRVVLLAVLISTQAGAAPPHMSDGMLVDDHGMTLYAFAGHGSPDATACEGDCERNFPPAIADPSDKPTARLSIIKTAKGERQWAYQGRPLHHGRMDKKPGDHQGDGLNGAWYPIRQ